MKKRSLYTMVSFILFSFLSDLCAQVINDNTIITENTRVLNVNGNVTLHTDINLNNLKLGAQEMVYIVPTLVSADNMNSIAFDPIVVTSPTRYKVLKRSMEFNNIHFDKKPKMMRRYHRGRQLMFPLDLSFNYQPWMDNSKLVFVEDVSGCGCTKLSSDQYTVIDPVLPVQFVPKYEISYIVPPVEEVKQRSETYSARINFEVNKHQILYNYKNNAQVLNEVDKIINEIRNDNNLTVSQFSITGYASPEGNEQSNMTLSKNRAEAFVRYLMDKYRITPTSIKTDWRGEDWSGLRKAVENANMDYKSEVLNILDNTPNVATRKNKLKQLAGGAPYRYMLNDLYPPLRRNDYTISYISRAFDVNEAREIIKTKPQYLSQNEMYQVANSYPRGSRERKEVLEIISRHYPDDEIAVLNHIAYQIDNGDSQAVIGRLQNSNRPEAWNNLGIAYYEAKDYQKAGEYFRRAASAGYQPAINNLAQYDKFMQSVNQPIYMD